MQTVRVRLFARFRDLLDADTIELTLSDRATVSELREVLASRVRDARSLLASSRIAVNGEFAAEIALVAAADEIALIPPVSGG